MKDLIFIAISFLPIAISGLLLVICRGKRFIIQTISVFIGTILSLPVGGSLIALNQGLVFTRGHDHNPGVGVVFLPLVAIWALTIALSFFALLVSSVIYVRHTKRLRANLFG